MSLLFNKPASEVALPVMHQPSTATNQFQNLHEIDENQKVLSGLTKF
jgi:hypothetical protein